MDRSMKVINRKRGTGLKAIPGDSIQVHYTGYLEDGTVFDSSVDRGTPFTFVVGEGRVIKGWDQAFLRMIEGSKMTLVIPPELGYGDRNMGKIPPNSILIFDVEFIKNLTAGKKNS